MSAERFTEGRAGHATGEGFRLKEKAGSGCLKSECGGRDHGWPGTHRSGRSGRFQIRGGARPLCRGVVLLVGRPVRGGRAFEDLLSGARESVVEEKSVQVSVAHVVSPITKKK